MTLTRKPDNVTNPCFTKCRNRQFEITTGRWPGLGHWAGPEFRLIHPEDRIRYVALSQICLPPIAKGTHMLSLNCLPNRRQHPSSAHWKRGLLAVAMAFFVAACGGNSMKDDDGGGGGGDADGTAAPTVTETFPAHEAEDVALDVVITVTFSKDMDENSLNFTFYNEMKGQNVNATASYADKTLTITPDADLLMGNDYSVTIDGTDHDTETIPLGSDYGFIFQAGYGTVTALTVDGASISGTVTQGNWNQYSVPATSGQTYTVTMTMGSGPADLGVYLCATSPCTGSDYIDYGAIIGGKATVVFTADSTADYYAATHTASTADYGISVASTTTLTVGTALTGQSLATGTTEKFAFTTSTQGLYTVFIYDRSATSDTWTISGYGSTTQYPSIIAHNGGSNQGADKTLVFNLTNSASSAVSYTILVLQGDGMDGGQSAPVALSLGLGGNDRGIAEATGSAAHYYSFETGALDDYTITVSSTTLDLEYRLFSDSTFSTPVTVGAGLTACFPAGGTAVCTTNADLGASTVYYMKVVSRTPTESYDDDVTITVVPAG